MKRTKKITQTLMAIAKQLPREQYSDFNAFRGTVSTGDKNHFRRIKRAFDSNGAEGVQKYLSPYVKEELRETYNEKLRDVLCQR
jgi:hypothetical protein